MKITRWIKILLLTALLGMLGLLASLWVEHRTTLMLPEPTGPFAIGRTIDDWKDTKHELLVWIWYPADASQSGVAFDDYLPASVRPPASRKGGVSIFR
jgi:hypothetical protein